MIISGFPDRKIHVDGKDFLYFGGTSYLGMATHPKFQKLVAENIKKWGTNYGSSRNANIKLSVFEAFERMFSNFIGSEASITVSSGTLAGKLVTDLLSRTSHCSYHYPKTHPAILSNNSLPLFVDGHLHPRLTDSIKEDIVITVDAILSLEVKPTSLDFLNDISTQKSVTLIIDESHSLGIVGENGAGIFKSVNYPNVVRKIMISSLGKALGLSAGIIASDREFIEFIKSEILFISSSGANPAYLASFLMAQDLFKEQRVKLKENLNYLFNSDQQFAEKFKYHVDYPVIYCSSDAIYKHLHNKGIIITNFKYPTYIKAMNRIVISANHRFQDLEQLKLALKTS